MLPGETKQHRLYCVGVGETFEAVHIFLGIEQAPKTIKKLSYKEAVNFLKDKKLNSNIEYRKYIKKNNFNFLVTNPSKLYSNEWKGWLDYLSKNNWNKNKVNFQDFKKLIRSKKFTTIREYHQYRKKNINLPSSPDRSYKKIGWTSWADVLGIDHLSNARPLLKFKQAKKLLKDNNIKSAKQYRLFYKKNKNLGLPSSPERQYKDDFKDWGDFLSTNYIHHSKREYFKFNSLKKIAKDNEIDSMSKWLKFVKDHKNTRIPLYPNQVWKEYWKGWDDFLGKK